MSSYVAGRTWNIVSGGKVGRGCRLMTAASALSQLGKTFLKRPLISRACACQDGRVIVWDTNFKKLREHELRGEELRSVQMDEDGRLLVGAESRWDLQGRDLGEQTSENVSIGIRPQL
jgi:WD40 repeat protein